MPLLPERSWKQAPLPKNAAEQGDWQCTLIRKKPRFTLWRDEALSTSKKRLSWPERILASQYESRPAEQMCTKRISEPFKQKCGSGNCNGRLKWHFELLMWHVSFGTGKTKVQTEPFHLSAQPFYSFAGASKPSIKVLTLWGTTVTGYLPLDYLAMHCGVIISRKVKVGKAIRKC